jgi:hypothetical protein
MGFQRETASRGSLAMYTSVCLPVLFCFYGIMTRLFKVLFAVVLEFVVFHTIPTSLSIAGAIIIMGTAIYVSVISRSTSDSTCAHARIR